MCPVIWANVRSAKQRTATVPIPVISPAGIELLVRISPLDVLDKRELIIEGTIKQKEKERPRGKNKHSNLYILGLDHEIDALRLIRDYIGIGRT